MIHQPWKWYTKFASLSSVSDAIFGFTLVFWVCLDQGRTFHNVTGSQKLEKLMLRWKYDLNLGTQQMGSSICKNESNSLKYQNS